MLHFGAVDQECHVYLNGRRVGSHKGGYLPFSFDITELLTDGENVLTLCVKDMTEKSPHARGKQKLVKKENTAHFFIRLKVESGKLCGWKVFAGII